MLFYWAPSLFSMLSSFHDSRKSKGGKTGNLSRLLCFWWDSSRQFPLLSALIAATLTFAISVYLLALFLIPLDRMLGAKPDPATPTVFPTLETRESSSLFGWHKNQQKIEWMIFITNAIAIICTVLFNATASTSTGDWEPMISALDCAFTM
ncbi:hypothetical protein BJ742DRAFT_787939 [Cladochytrium replicatum]|nr:hypothetical protein BJ742DRAFT_787939 [Cladochytrium replicatum]